MKFFFQLSTVLLLTITPFIFQASIEPSKSSPVYISYYDYHPYNTDVNQDLLGALQLQNSDLPRIIGSHLRTAYISNDEACLRHKTFM
jgi:hypothetical protein